MKSPIKFKRAKRIWRRLTDTAEEVDRWRRPTRNVAVISYPKSGRTWLRFMLNAIDVRLLFAHAGAENREACRFEELTDQPSEWRDWRIIFLFRDPRDTVVSSYFEATKRLKPSQRFQGTIGEFMRSPHYGLAKIARFNLLWLESAGKFRGFTAVSYEDLHRDTEGELARVLRFATGRPVDARKVAGAAKAGHFDNMRKVERSLKGKMNERLKLGGGDLADLESLKTRRGKVGGWIDYFDDIEARVMDEILAGLRYRERSEALYEKASTAR